MDLTILIQYSTVLYIYTAAWNNTHTVTQHVSTKSPRTHVLL